jgi:hypothetical protein
MRVAVPVVRICAPSARTGYKVWQWPANESAPALHLLCGDIYNGVLLRPGDGAATTLLDLDSNGQERWHIPAPGFAGKEFVYNMSGALRFGAKEMSAMVFFRDRYRYDASKRRKRPSIQRVVRELDNISLLR